MFRHDGSRLLLPGGRSKNITAKAQSSCILRTLVARPLSALLNPLQRREILFTLSSEFTSSPSYLPNIDVAMGRVLKSSKATKFNAHTLKKLEEAFQLDSEVDLTTKLPTDYSSRLDSWLSAKFDNNHNNTAAPVRPHEEDIRSSLDVSASVETIYPLSKSVLDLLEDASPASGSPSDGFSGRLIGMIQASEILWRGPSARCKYVILAVPFNGLVIHGYQPCRVLDPLDIALAKNTNVELPDKASGSLRLNLQNVAFECWVLADDFEDNTICIALQL
ncbi:hypothetical protein BDW69DRAFT_176628 [Aspergillus filifer]